MSELSPDLREAVERVRKTLALSGSIVASESLDALALIEQRLMECPLCGHEWSRHDPEDGRCDAPAEDGLFECQCGRDMWWMQERIGARSLAALSPKGEAVSDLPGYIERGGEMTPEDWKQAAEEARRDREHHPAGTDQQSAEVERDTIILALTRLPATQAQADALAALRALAQRIETLTRERDMADGFRRSAEREARDAESQRDRLAEALQESDNGLAKLERQNYTGTWREIVEQHSRAAGEIRDRIAALRDLEQAATDEGRRI